MLVFKEACLVLLAVPKTGTTALETALNQHADIAIMDPPEHKHCSVRVYNHEVRDFFETDQGPAMELAAVIREPVDWLRSWHRYRARPELFGTPVSTQHVTFDAFVEGWLDDNQPDFAQIGRQSRFVDWSEGRTGVDHLFRYDRIDELMAFLGARLGQEISLPMRNVSPDRHQPLSSPVLDRMRADAEEEFLLWDHVVRICS
ncbi:gamma-glutamyl kinase [Gymnodinialimonas sp. 2305UL16-5]|uniref:gamma-glutamyl kinase n=1 Tax=Gymnodinialimonas mytili TaxID=3126503 RepID=UPI00309B6C33